MVSLLVIVPLLVTLLVCLGAGFYVMKRKSLAQAICVQQAARIQQELKKPLQKLVKLNPRATSLRTQRQTADANLDAALGSGYPPAIAAAQAVQVAVILQQTELHLHQLALLTEAQRIRDQGQRELRRRVQPLNAVAVHSQVYYYRPLAVEPRPPLSLSPNYETVTFFPSLQQHRFRFAINLLAGFPIFEELRMNTHQLTECAVTLNGKDQEWDIHILTAKAR